MLVITALGNYYRYTGDAGFVRRHWPAVARQMAWDAEQVDANGLFAVTGTDGADWNVENISGELTYVNAVYVQALRSAATLADAVGRHRWARSWRTTASRVTRAINRHLFNPLTDVYDASTGARGSVVQDSNVTAILAGIPAPARARGIVARLARDLAGPFGPLDASANAPGLYTRDVSPYMGSFAVLAAFAAGDEPAALAIIRREWGYMVRHDPGGTDWERIQLTGIPTGGAVADSSAHAWSTGPTAALSQYVLGVVPRAPGFRSWTVAPQPGALRWAQGTVPTPHGPIAVRWRRVGGARNFVLTVEAPRRTAGTVAIPVARDGVIARDGQVVWSHGRPARGVRARRAGGAVVLAVGRGTSTFAT
jgi:alpha-L-rhamnosidase